MANSVKLRLRVPDGTDIGPLVFPISTRVVDVKAAVLDDIVNSNNRSTPPPASVKQLVIIHAGRVVDDSLMLSGIYINISMTLSHYYYQ